MLTEFISRLKLVPLLQSAAYPIVRTPAQAGYDNRLPASDAPHREKPAPQRSVPISALLATVVVALLYVGLLSWYLPLDGFWSGDQGTKLVQVQALVRSQYRDLGLPYPGATIDPAGAFSPVPLMFSWPVGERSYSIYSYAHAFLTTIPYVLFGQFGLHVIPVIATLAIMVTAVAISRRLSVRPSWLVPPVIGLATPLSFYALVFWEHALAVCLTTLAVFCVLKADGRHLSLRADFCAQYSYACRIRTAR